ncbi:uncharacterized protein N0V96_002288 [Colletotrichum fioriniae]|uniref:uncharacterized protein n=1 Tax=Colletotrichum fioriniae TaxID=710243 RepID=UPI0032DB5592|nr:hypothetical protein N0V96_002288 [Colletotrichum fioriniae]
MVRRLPWTHPHLKVGHAAESKPHPKRRKRDTSTTIATTSATTPIRNNIDTGTRDISSYFSSTRKMGYRTPRSGGGRRLMYNSGGGGGGSSRKTTTPYTPNRSGGGGGGRTYSPSPPPSQKKRLDGLFLEGNWYCNCQPRNTAKFLQVSKNTANRGRWFYTCEKRRGGCNFFLWAEDAENRAEGATMTLPPMPQDGAAAAATTPRRTTTGQTQGGFTPSTASTIKPAASAGALAHSSTAMTEPPSSPTAQRSAAKQKFMDTYFKNRPVQVPEEEEPNDLMVTDEEAELTTPAQRKRKRVLFDFDSDDDNGEEAQGQGQGGAGTDDYGLDDDVSSDEERAMTEAMERSAKKLRTVGGGGGAPSTPAAQRTVHDGALPTPQTVSRTLFPGAKRRKVGEDVVGEISPGNASFSTSTSSATLGRSTAAGGTGAPPSSSPPTSTPQEEQLDPTEEVMDLLRQGQKGVGVDDATARDVRAVLGRFAMKAKGLARGRDTVRTALKAKDEKIAELQERVASLEARARTQREQIADFKAGMMDLYSKH